MALELINSSIALGESDDCADSEKDLSFDLQLDSKLNMENPNISIVQKFYECYASGDLEGMKTVMAEDVEWHIPGHHSLAGTKKGVAEIVAYFKLLQKANFKAEVNILSANKDYVIDCHRGYGEYDGKKIDINWVLLYQVEDGKIRKVQNFAGDQHEADAFFLHTWKLKPIPDRVQE